MHHELIHALGVNIHALREDFIPRRKFMHREKILYLVEMYASQEDFIPCEIYALRKDIHAPQKIMHRESIDVSLVNSCIARRFHISQKCMHRKKISYLAEFMHCGKIFMPRRRSCIESQFMHRESQSMHH